jgi:hypothetical protein
MVAYRTSPTAVGDPGRRPSRDARRCRARTELGNTDRVSGRRLRCGCPPVPTWACCLLASIRAMQPEAGAILSDDSSPRSPAMPPSASPRSKSPRSRTGYLISVSLRQAEIRHRFNPHSAAATLDSPQREAACDRRSPHRRSASQSAVIGTEIVRTGDGRGCWRARSKAWVVPGRARPPSEAVLLGP